MAHFKNLIITLCLFGTAFAFSLEDIDSDFEIRADNTVDKEQCEKQLERAKTTFKNCMDKEVRDKPRSLELDEEISVDSVELRAKGDKKKGSSNVPEVCKPSIVRLKATIKRCGVKKTSKPGKGE